MQGLKRTHRCGELSAANVGETVTIMGWVQKNRNKGGLVFTDVRDRSGIIQVVCEEGTTDAAIIEKAASLRAEYVVAVVGKVEKRSGAVNDKIATGEIEVIPSELRVLSESQTPPFPIEENSKTKEDNRLKYRYLDLRRPDLQRNLRMKSQVMTLTRQFFSDEGFLEVETPMLGKTTPEGARDYLVPSRVHPGSFYGLPQSPQLYKQLLMCSGVDRYIQIARCFRDEDLRADRQPEFTQIDMELSFVDVDDVIEVNEKYLKKLFKEVLDVDVQLPIQRMTWQEAMNRYGSDKGSGCPHRPGLQAQRQVIVRAGNGRCAGFNRVYCVQQRCAVLDNTERLTVRKQQRARPGQQQSGQQEQQPEYAQRTDRTAAACLPQNIGEPAPDRQVVYAADHAVEQQDEPQKQVEQA